MINLFAAVMLIILLDQFSKYACKLFLVSGTSIPVLKGIFHLTLVYNKGSAFGFFQSGTPILIFISFLCIFVIVLLLRRNVFLGRFLGIDLNHRAIRFSLGLILGGAFGNLIDRLRYGYVVDFLDFRIWPVFNLADSAITIGGIIIFFNILRQERKDGL